MENLTRQILAWEIQLLVLISFGLQLFLFFTGGLRRHGSNRLLRLSIWIAYLGADMVAVYALGYLSKHDGATPGCDTLRGAHPLVFFWAPFLIIHLGGQDTITAFAMEDNNLWLRHLLNLVVQVVLAIYVFWNSIHKQSTEILMSGILVFVVGIIKYGERIWSLKNGSFESLKSSSGNQYKQRLPQVIHANGSYSDAACTSLQSMIDVFHIFSARPGERYMRQQGAMQPKKLLKVLEIQLGMMYDDLYTKAHVLRTKSGIIIRGISQICLVVAFVLFLTVDHRQSYTRADIVITCSLFAGSFFLEACAAFIFMMSPWTLAWLEAGKHEKLARFSWFLFTIGWSENRPLWSNVVGQCNLCGWLEGQDDISRSCNKLLRKMITKMVTLVGIKREKVFSMRVLMFGTEYVKADKLLDCLLQGVSRFFDENPDTNGIIQIPQIWLSNHGLVQEADLESADGYSSMWEFVSDSYTRDFSSTIVVVHFLTEITLSKCSELDGNVEEDTRHLVELCRALSRYTMYLLVNHPSLLPVSANTIATLERSRLILQEMELGSVSSVDVRKLKEIRDVWTGIIIYVAAKSRPEMHAAQLARGGELLTFVWLLLAEYKLGDLGGVRLELTNILV